MPGLFPSHTISDVRNGAIPFLPFLEAGRTGKAGGGNRVSAPPQFCQDWGFFKKEPLLRFV